MRERTRALLGFAGFGLFWGAWGAALPVIQSHAGASDSELGLALLCIGAGALASMRPAGALVDRLGPGVLPVAVVLFAGSAVLPALAASPPALAGALLVLGALSGAVDVAINAEAAHAEAAGRPAMNLAHAAFSASVVAASLLVGALRSLDAGALTLLGAVAALLVIVAAVLSRIAVERGSAVEPSRASLLHIPAPLVILGTLAALAYLPGGPGERRLGGHDDRLRRLPRGAGGGRPRRRRREPSHRARRRRRDRRRAGRWRALRARRLTFRRGRGLQTRRSDHCAPRQPVRAWTP